MAAALAAEKRKRDMAVRALNELRCLALPAVSPLRQIEAARQEDRGPSDVLLTICFRQAAAMQAKAGALYKTMCAWFDSHEKLFQGLPVATWRTKMEAVKRAIANACAALRAASMQMEAQDVVIPILRGPVTVDPEAPVGFDFDQAQYFIDTTLESSRQKLITASEQFMAARVAVLDAFIAGKELLELF